MVFSLAYFPFVGGAEVFVKEIGKRLSKQYQFEIITARLKRGLSTVSKTDGMTVYRVGWGVEIIDKIFYPLFALRKAMQLKKSNQFSHSIMAGPAGLATLLFHWICKEPYLLTLQEGESERQLHIFFGLIWPLYLSVYKNAYHIHAISNYLKKRALRYGYNKSITVIPNGVDLHTFQSKSAAIGYLRNKFKANIKNIVITASRLVHKNGVDSLIEALRFLDDSYHLLILGTGKQKYHLINMTKRWELEKKVSFIGHVEHRALVRYLSVADVFVRPSRSEGLGNSFLESMAVGIPVIGTKVGGIPDFLKDGKTGLFCKVDNPKDIAEKIKTLCENKNLRERISKEGQRFVRERFSWDRIAQQIKNIYERIP